MILRFSVLSVTRGVFGLLTILSVACSAESRLRAEGATPYVRCSSAPEPGDRTVSVGGVKVAIKGRRATISGLPAEPKIAAFAGPGLGEGASPAVAKGLAASGADLFILLGGLGETSAEVGKTVKALSDLSRPVLFVAGGRDRFGLVESELSGSSRIIDVTALHELRIGPHTLIPVGGADGGRYAIDGSACGFGSSDLAARAKTLGAAGGSEASRWLLSWHAPAAAPGRVGITRTESGVDTGSWTLSRFASQVHAKGGLYAWPSTQSSRALLAPGEAFSLIVPRAWGPRPERSDGSRATLGFALVTLRASGLESLR